MSVRIMAQVFDSDLPSTERLVMLALADHADDEGRCYPSIRRLCARTGLKERAVQGAIKRLQERGCVRIDPQQGKSGANLYTLTPAGDAPPQEMHPRTKCTTPPHIVRDTPAPNAPEPSITINEPSEKKARGALDLLCEVASLEASRSFIAYRRKQKGKSLSETAATRQAKQLAEIARRGGDPDDALGMAEERGWQAVQADWYFKALSQQNPKQEKADVVGLAQRAAARARGMDSRPGHDPAVPLLPASRWRGNSGGGAG